MIAAVVPTVPGRQQLLARCVDSLSAECDSIYVLRGYGSCGGAWDRGMQLALADGADFILLCADDLEALAGWSIPAVEQLQQGELPAARLYNADSSVWNPDELGDVPFSRVPMVTAEQARQLLPFPDLHYYSDGLVADWLGRRTVLRPPGEHGRQFAFIHRMAQEGRLHDADGADWKRYQRLRQQRPGDAFP